MIMFSKACGAGGRDIQSMLMISFVTVHPKYQDLVLSGLPQEHGARLLLRKLHAGYAISKHLGRAEGVEIAYIFDLRSKYMH